MTHEKALERRCITQQLGIRLELVPGVDEIDCERDRVAGFLEHSRMLTSKDQSRLMTLTDHFEPGGQDEEGLRRRNACRGARAGCPGRSSCSDHDALGS